MTSWRHLLAGGLCLTAGVAWLMFHFKSDTSALPEHKTTVESTEARTATELATVEDLPIDISVREPEWLLPTQDAGVAPSMALPETASSRVDAGVLDSPITADASAPSLATGEERGAEDRPGRPRDPRFIIRWDKPGNCLDSEGRDKLEQRRLLLATFQPANVSGWALWSAPDVPDPVLTRVGQELSAVFVEITQLLGPRAANLQAPHIYVYSNVEQLLEHSCVNRSARGYYDGSIHLAAESDAAQTAAHEYVHHVLNGLGVRKPMWLHEGLAMELAKEHWWRDPRAGLLQWIQHNHLPFSALVEAFPHTSDERFAVAVYFQSHAMVMFVQQRPSGGVRRLVEELGSGTVLAPDAFTAATGLQGGALETAWDSFVQSSF